MELTDNERNLVLAGLFELSIGRAGDEGLRAQIATLVQKLGGSGCTHCHRYWRVPGR